VVEFEVWQQYYNQILKSFGFSREHDERSARLLDRLLPQPRLSIPELESMIFGRTVFIFGAHESIESGIEMVISKGLEGVFLAADGACSPMRSLGLKPDLIISDLDGNLEDLLFWNRNGVPMVVHAHGDNMERIRSITPNLINSMATTQSETFNDVYNFGGFTDGDRCVFIADHFGAYHIYLIGFNFDRVGKYSFTMDPEMKIRKLRWAKKLISLFEVDYL